MGYGNPLHGLDSEGNKIPPTDEEGQSEETEKGNPRVKFKDPEQPTEASKTQIPDWVVESLNEQMKANQRRPPMIPADAIIPEPLELPRAAAIRVLAAQMAVSVLRKGQFSLSSVKAQDVLDLADWFLNGGPDAGEENQQPQPFRPMMTMGDFLTGPSDENSAEQFRQREQDFARKVQERVNTFKEPLESFLRSMAEQAGLKTEMVDPSDLRVGDHVAPDGDEIISKPVYNLPMDRWEIEVRCPNKPEDPFIVHHAGESTPFTVYGDRPEG